MAKITVKELTKYLKAEAKRLRSDWEDVPEWIISASVKYFNDKNSETIEDKLGNYICEDEEFYPRIIKALKKALKKKPNMMVDEVKFDKGNDNEVDMETITMWEPMEYTLTVKQLCDTIGIE